MTIRQRLGRILFAAFTCFACLGTGGAAFAQQTAPTIAVAQLGQLQELILRDGTRAIGRVEKVANGKVTFRTDAGATLEVDIAQVVSASVTTGRVVAGDFWPEDANPTRLFFGPTGRNLKRGESYFGIYEIYIPFVQYGVTDRFSIGGGTPLFLGSGVSHPFWFTPKLQIVKRPTTEASIGVMHFLNIEDASVGIAYGAVTQGSRDSALTVGVGWAYSRTDNSEGNAAVFMLGGEHRLSRRTKFVTENYFFSGHAMVSGGFRFMGERLSADLGLFTPLGEDYFGVLPMVNFVWKFTK